MKKILIGGYYGANNTGDEAILSALLQTFRDMRSEVEFTIVSHSPGLTESQHGKQAVYWRDIPALAQAVKQADLVVIGGGGLFMDYWGFDQDSYFRSAHGGISTYGTLAFLAHAFDIPYMLCGVGLGPLNGDIAREHTRRIFSQARLATLRDGDSLSLLKEIGLDPLPEYIRLTTDIAFALQSSSEELVEAAEYCKTLDIDRETPLLGISVRYWDRPISPQKWLPPLAEAVREFLTRLQANGILFPFQVATEGKLTDDLQICQSLAQEVNLPGQLHIMDHVLPVREMQAMLGQCNLILGMRLHALLMGVNNHIPIVGLAYDPKVSSFMKQADLEQLVCPIPPDPQELAQLLMQVWQERIPYSSKIKSFQEKMRPLARENIELALQILDAPRPEASYETLSSFLIERLAQMQDLDLNLQEATRRVQALYNELDEARGQAALLSQRLREVENSRTYRLALVLQRLRNILFPPNSRRETWLLYVQRLFRQEVQN